MAKFLLVGMNGSNPHSVIGYLSLYQLLHTLILEPFQSKMITNQQFRILW